MARDEHLTFPVLSDPTREVHDKYGTFGEKLLYGRTVHGVIRATFVLDEDGRITLPLYNIRATGHVAMLRKKLKLACLTRRCRVLGAISLTASRRLWI